MLLSTQITSVTFDGHFGAVHAPRAGAAADVAVVICPAVGRDARCAYRAMFSWAQDLASRGVPVLRYDALGEGDSAPLEPHADQLRHWISGVAQAANFARRHTGARQLVLAGLRLGGTLALAAARQVRPDGLVLLAPLPSGDAYLRELKLAAAVQKAPFDEAREIQLDGLRLSRATIAGLRSLDAASASPVWRAAFLATPGPPGPLAKRLGENLTVARFEGYSRLFKEPHLNQAPSELLSAASEWVSTFAAGAKTAAPAVRLPPARLEAAGWVERPVTFGSGLRGVICLPRAAHSGQAVLIGNTAGDPRAGVGNFGVRAARALASRGVAALRFDFSGLGESDGQVDEAEINCKSRVDEFQAAADVVRRYGFDRLTPMGVCTGGYHAVEAVLAGGNYERAVAYNAWLVYRPGRTLFLRSETAKGAKPRPQAPPGSSWWARVVHGEIDLGHVLARRARQSWSSLRTDAYCRGARRKIRRASRAGARIHLLQGRGDEATRSLESDFGVNCLWLRLQRGVRVSMLGGLEHALRTVQSQEEALQELFGILGADTPRAARLVGEAAGPAFGRAGGWSGPVRVLEPVGDKF